MNSLDRTVEIIQCFHSLRDLYHRMVQWKLFNVFVLWMDYIARYCSGNYSQYTSYSFISSNGFGGDDWKSFVAYLHLRDSVLNLMMELYHLSRHLPPMFTAIPRFIV